MMRTVKRGLFAALLVGIGAVGLINEIGISRYPPAGMFPDGAVRGFFAASPEEPEEPGKPEEPGEYAGSPGAGASGWRKLDFEIIGLTPHEPLGDTKPANLIVQVLDHRGTPIGEYYVASAVLHGQGGGHVAVTGFVGWIPHRDAEAVWNRWATGPPDHKGRWAELPAHERAAWLEVAGLYRGTLTEEPNSEDDVFLDGANIDDLTSFFCAMGEAVNGPGGYFGWNLTAFAECLRGRAPFVLHWSDFDIARQALAGEGDMIVDILTTTGVELRSTA